MVSPSAREKDHNEEEREVNPDINAGDPRYLEAPSHENRTFPAEWYPSLLLARVKKTLGISTRQLRDGRLRSFGTGG
jgi:hypothetical protein